MFLHCPLPITNRRTIKKLESYGVSFGERYKDNNLIRATLPYGWHFEKIGGNPHNLIMKNENGIRVAFVYMPWLGNTGSVVCV